MKYTKTEHPHDETQIFTLERQIIKPTINEGLFLPCSYFMEITIWITKFPNLQ
jgi:hypothetical protein